MRRRSASTTRCSSASRDGLDAVNKFGQGSIGFPFTVFTDNQGRIVLFHLGDPCEQAEVAVRRSLAT
jgi:hypothetical protein